jgi:Uncharacterized conserved protein (DUF2278)
MALDFIRANLFDPQQMQAVPASVPGPDNDLADKLDHFVRRTAADSAARLYAFGQRWGPEAGIPDKIFGFLPGNGVHDIHMNQGNSQRFRQDDGVWQDGGLLLHYPAQDQWVGVFLAFQSQEWHTDDQTGHTVPELPEADHIVRIVAALVNPPGPAPEAETVMLLNASPQQVDLTGWAILDRPMRLARCLLAVRSGCFRRRGSEDVQRPGPLRLPGSNPTASAGSAARGRRICKPAACALAACCGSRWVNESSRRWPARK